MTNKTRREFMQIGMSALVGAMIVGNADLAQASQKTVQTQRAESKLTGLVVSSNKDLELAQLSVEMIQTAGLEKAYIQEVKMNGNTFYRSVYPISSESYVPGVMKVLEKLDYFSLDEAFKIYSDSQISDVKPKIHNNFHKSDIKSATSLEKVLSQKEFVRTVTQSEIQKVSTNLTLTDYLAKFTPYVMKAHKDYYHVDISKDLAKQVLTYIYQNAKEFKAPVIRAVAIYLHESKGSPDCIGDENLAPNISIGPYQMRLSTIDYVRNKMKQKGLNGFSDKPAAELEGDYRSLVRLGVWYFADNIHNSGGSSDLGTIKHNAGHNSRLRSSSYLRKVKAEEAALKSALGGTN